MRHLRGEKCYNETKTGCKEPGLDEEETVLKYCPVLTGEREMLHQHVRSFSKFWVTGRRKKLCI